MRRLHLPLVTLRATRPARPVASALRLWAALLVLLAAGGGATVHAQGGAPRAWLARADTLAAGGDTLGAIAILDTAVTASPKDFVLWHRRGILAAEVTKPYRRRGFIRDGKYIRLLVVADSALRQATYLAPDSAGYYLDLATFLFGAAASTLDQSIKVLEKGVAAARRTGDSALVARTADQLGMFFWRRYEVYAHRRQLIGVAALSEDALLSEMAHLDAYLDAHTMAFKPPLGRAKYDDALRYFTEALAADRHNQSALKHVLMAYAEMNEWGALAGVAERHLAAVPWDPWAWLGLGLARHRQGNGGAAAAAFDSAFVFLPQGDLTRLTRLTRLLRAGDSTKLATMDTAQRGRLERIYWLTADPLTLTPGNEFRNEFLARVTFAELRWSNEEFGLHGADSDRGEVYIRYGPPGVQAQFGASTESFGNQETTDESGNAGPGFGSEAMGHSTLWYYPRLALHFVFTTPPTYGSGRFWDRYQQLAKDAREQSPANFLNLPIARLQMDSVPVQIARFRGGGDTTELMVVADVPVRKMVAGLTATLPVDMAFTLTDLDGRTLVRDSTRQTVDAAHPDPVERRSWRRRVRGGAGAGAPLIYRVEALQPDSLRAARALGEVAVAPDTGFGVSDLLVADRVAPKRGEAGSRWTDFNIVPNAGVFTRGRAVGMLWETYALTPAAGGGPARYKVVLTLERAARTGVRAFATKVLAGASGVIGLEARGEDKVSITFTREVAAQPTVADFLSLDLGTAGPGSYTLRIEVTDLVSGKTATRERAIRVTQ